MKDLKRFRIINEIENKIIIDSISEISPKISSILSEIDYKLFISFKRLPSEDKFPSIYLIPNDLAKTLNRYKLENNINSAGLYFGFIKRNKFLLSLEGSEFLYKLNLFSEKYKVSLNIDGEKSVLYGNNITKKMILNISHDLKKNNLVLVFNQVNELISIANIKADYSTIQNFKPTEVIALNLVDKGYYLRKKQ